jgi:predicted DNA-binding protein with PD1-like motif
MQRRPSGTAEARGGSSSGSKQQRKERVANHDRTALVRSIASALVIKEVEVVSLIGDVARTEKGEAMVHAHVVLGWSDGSALAGHLIEGHVRPTLEVVLVEVSAHLQRKYDPESRLALIRL